jgi:hypothetical protein
MEIEDVTMEGMAIGEKRHQIIIIKKGHKNEVEVYLRMGT